MITPAAFESKRAAAFELKRDEPLHSGLRVAQTVSASGYPARLRRRANDSSPRDPLFRRLRHRRPSRIGSPRFDAPVMVRYALVTRWHSGSKGSGQGAASARVRGCRSGWRGRVGGVGSTLTAAPGTRRQPRLRTSERLRRALSAATIVDPHAAAVEAPRAATDARRSRLLIQQARVAVSVGTAVLISVVIAAA